jgi:hypothetical protein
MDLARGKNEVLGGSIEFCEKPRVFDRQRRLVGEGLQDRALPVIKGRGLRSADFDAANLRAHASQRQHESCAMRRSGRNLAVVGNPPPCRAIQELDDGLVGIAGQGGIAGDGLE